MTKHVLLVSGPQGSGKSTQAELIAKRYDLPLFEAGVELRAFVETQKPGVEQVKLVMSQGLLVPHHYVDDLFLEFVDEHTNPSGVISDGYPRSLEQWHIIEKICEKLNAKVVGLNISLEESVAIQRISSRVEAQDGKLVHRQDDTPDAIRERLKIYHEQTMPVLEHIKMHHQLFVIDGAADIDSVSSNVFEALDPILKR